MRDTVLKGRKGKEKKKEPYFNISTSFLSSLVPFHSPPPPGSITTLTGDPEAIVKGLCRLLNIPERYIEDNQSTGQIQNIRVKNETTIQAGQLKGLRDMIVPTLNPLTLPRERISNQSRK